MNLANDIRSVSAAAGEVAVCWLGQAGFFLKDERGNTLVLDPYLSNCGERMRGFKRLSAMLIGPEELAPDYHVTTHLHFDHFDYDAIPVIAQNSPKTLFLGPSSCVNKFQEIGVPGGRCYRLDRGDVYKDRAITIQAVLADHGDMAPDAIGVLLEMGGHRLYFSGDTAFHEDLFERVADFGPDAAFLSINGQFGNMDAREGADAALLTGAPNAVPCHCWTFAEHKGDPGAFCDALRDAARCRAVCFRQGEIQILNRENQLLEGRECMDESYPLYAAGSH